MKFRFPNRLVLSAMAGINNAKFCMQHPVGMAILGGFSADRASMNAARKVIKRGRKEFIFENPLEGIAKEVKLFVKSSSGKFAINVRSATVDGYVGAADISRRYGGIIEINAHCRQPEFVEAGCGQWLMKHPELLEEIIREVSEIAPVSVKIRNGKNCVNVAKRAFKAGASLVHIDAMVPGNLCDFEVVKKISRLGMTVGNNSVSTIEMAEKMAEVAHLVSAARAVLKDPLFFHKLLSSPILAEPLTLDL